MFDDEPASPSDAFGAYTPNALNQYTAAPGLASMVYDENGNMTSDGVRSYTYDAENRLIQVTQGSAVWRYQYDYLGRRVAKSGTGMTEVRFLYDGWMLLAELDASGNMLRRFVWGLDASGSLAGAGGVGGLLLIDATTAQYWPVYDASHNVIALYTSTGGFAAAYEYDPFGNLQTQAGSYATSNPFRAATKYADAETGFAYYGYRYYSATLGRFINRDPLEEAGSLNLYAFCGNDGVNRYDVLGLDDIVQLEKYVVVAERIDRLERYQVQESLRELNESRNAANSDQFAAAFWEGAASYWRDRGSDAPNSGFDAGSQRGDVIAAGGITERSQARAENFKKYRNMYVNDLGSYLKAKEALIKANPQLAGYFDRLETNRMPVILNVNKGSVSQFRPDSMIINWDPTYVSVTGDKERAPGVIGLIHEMGHFMNFVTDPTGYTARVRAGDDQFDNREERFVTTGVEWATADAMEYGRRSSHTPIATYHSDSMFSTQFSY